MDRRVRDARTALIFRSPVLFRLVGVTAISFTCASSAAGDATGLRENNSNQLLHSALLLGGFLLGIVVTWCVRRIARVIRSFRKRHSSTDTDVSGRFQSLFQN